MNKIYILSTVLVLATAIFSCNIYLDNTRKLYYAYGCADGISFTLNKAGEATKAGINYDQIDNLINECVAETLKQ